MTTYFTGVKGSWVWLVIRLYLGYQWMTAGWNKFTGDSPYGALPHIKVFSFLVPYGELLVGVALLLGFASLFATTMGMIMNSAFLLSGTTSINPKLLFLEVILLTLGGAYAGYLGVDYWFRPLFRNQVARLLGTRRTKATDAA
jgi:thiosulfate dehydrogenase (quinone) large subunit